MLPNISALAYVNKVQEYKPGMAYMIEVFTTWCPPCRGMIPHLAELPTKYPNVYLVAVTEEEQDKVEAFSQKIPPMKKYNVACDAKGEVKALREAEAPNISLTRMGSWFGMVFHHRQSAMSGSENSTVLDCSSSHE